MELGTPSEQNIARQSRIVRPALTTAPRFVGRSPGPVCRGALAEGKTERGHSGRHPLIFRFSPDLVRVSPNSRWGTSNLVTLREAGPCAYIPRYAVVFRWAAGNGRCVVC